MLITDYTTYDEVRSTVGLNNVELPDATLGLEVYVNVVSLAFDSIVLPNTTDPGNGPLVNLFATVKALAESARTLKQRRLYALTRLFATYAVAFEICTSLSTRTAKEISDSKAAAIRFSSDATFLTTIKTIEENLDDIKDQLMNLSNEATVSLAYMGVASPADPITGA